jgi:hypothetical protein
MDIAYTLSPRAQLHAMVADVKRAIAWIKAHAGRYNVDPERFESHTLLLYNSSSTITKPTATEILS